MTEMINAIKTCLKIGNSDTMRRRVGARRLSAIVPGCETLTGDQYLECMARTKVVRTNHQVGTARMGDPNNPYTVVDSLLKVKGMENLRVVDACVMPTVPFGNTNILTIMVAEKASDIIKSTINCFTQNPFISQNKLPSSPYYQKPPLSPNVIL
ncbi:hypothetical protein JTE90_010283 [Oedothorax gibbosus]|uniref:Glucose-methanol-choline oxidoreductase C-terminal domain-containing protein n=1 Tax=Oedothorax gibbosus TaxID=931172 RepID=A0AAV6V238_9ARAC|nr:hypothetical protein JTE90_010283 [Oedothorax gibbosus]